MHRGSAEVIRRLAQSYPKKTVLEPLRHVYRQEVERALAEVGELLPRYRSAVDGPTYRFALIRLDLMAAYTRADGASVPTLEALLKALLRHKQRLAVLPVPSRTP